MAAHLVRGILSPVIACKSNQTAIRCAPVVKRSGQKTTVDQQANQRSTMHVLSQPKGSSHHHNTWYVHLQHVVEYAVCAVVVVVLKTL